MNVAFLGNQWLPHTKERIKHLRGRGNNVYYFSWPIEDNNIEDVVLLPFKNSLKWKDLIKHLFINVYQLRKLIKKNKIEILHIMGITNGIYSFFLYPTKVVVEHNGSDILIVPQKLWYYKWYYKLIYKFCSGVIQDSKVSRDAGISFGAPNNNNSIIDIGVDFSLFNENIEKGYIREKYNLSKDCKIILQPRGFREIYNNEIILQSIKEVKKKYSDIKYVFCGYYEHDSNIKEKILELGVQDDIIFVGRLSREKELPFYYSDSDIVISIPSSDSSPLSVFEAMACKTPVILSNLPWLDYKFKNINYCSISKFDSIQLAKKTISLLDNIASSNIDNLHKIVKNEINAAVESEKLEKFYLDLN